MIDVLFLLLPGSLILDWAGPAEALRTAHTDTTGRLWIAYDQGRIGFVEDGSFRGLGSAEGLPDATHSTIHEFFGSI